MNQRTASTQRQDALAGLLVIDFTIVMSGPMCTRMMADAGADVVKIEPPDGDVVRQRPPMRGNISSYYASMNCGKRSLVLDLASAEGKRLARELALKADVVVENFRPGVMKRLGLDYASLALENPKLIYASISGFGQSGPKAGAPAYAPVIHAASGYEVAYGEYQRDNERPANNGIFIADVMGASYAFSAIQMALYEREKSGKGQSIDVSLMDSVLSMLIYEIQAAQFPPNRKRQVYEPVRANDGWVMVAAVTQKNLDVLFEVIGYPEGKKDPRFTSVAAKESHWSELLELIEDWTQQRSGAECESVLMAAGVPCSRYRTVAEAMQDPQVQERGFMSELGSGDGTFKVPNAPYLLSATPTRARQTLAQLGEHSEVVLAEKLGLSEVEIQKLRRQGILGSVEK